MEEAVFVTYDRNESEWAILVLPDGQEVHVPKGIVPPEVLLGMKLALFLELPKDRSIQESSMKDKLNEILGGGEA